MTALKKAGMSVRSRRLSVAEGIELTRARLKGPRGPRLFIHKRCERLIECLQRYHYPTDRPESTEPDKRDGFDHAVDALRYLVVNLDRPHTCVRTEY